MRGARALCSQIRIATERPVNQLQVKVVFDGLRELGGLVIPFLVQFGHWVAFKGFLPGHDLQAPKQISHVYPIVLHGHTQTYWTGCSLFDRGLFTARSLMLPG